MTAQPSQSRDISVSLSLCGEQGDADQVVLVDANGVPFEIGHEVVTRDGGVGEVIGFDFEAEEVIFDFGSDGAAQVATELHYSQEEIDEYGIEIPESRDSLAGAMF